MLELKPDCEHCHKALPPEAEDARICSFECTFCADCVDNVHQGVCPNCGGNFVPRPIRPAEKLAQFPAGQKRHQTPLDTEEREEFIASMGNAPSSDY